MSSFRVQNARFRILKGGKIGLCLSITLIGGILFFPTSSYSQTFFDTTVGTTLTAFDISVQKFTDQDTTSTATYNETITPQDIIFKPSKVQSSFVGIQNNEFDGTNSVTIYSAGVTTGSNSFKVLDGEYTVTDGVIYNYDTYYYEEYSPSTNFTITLESGSKANDIKKESSIYYNVSNPNTYSNLSTSYTANIILKGNNVVSGTTNLGIDGNIIIEEDGVNFQNDVTAGEIEIYTDKTAQFGGNITGNIVGNTGTLELNGNKVQTINGDINSANTTITSGTTLELVNDKNISSTVTGDGNLILQGNNIISNSVNLTGDVTTKGTSNFQNSLTADKININSGITTVTGDINSTNTNISSTLDAKKNITSTVIGSGTLNMNGTVDQTITGTVGVENLNIANGS
ncbi:autotransporter outer membrane beta-barrel domain-containing protein, partial [Aliarcobacter cibarius]